MYVAENTWQELPRAATAGFGRYELVEPKIVMWETPEGADMSVRPQMALSGLGQMATEPSQHDDLKRVVDELSKLSRTVVLMGLAITSVLALYGIIGIRVKK